jgi:hypothetical protein
MAAIHAPISLFPSPFPRRLFELAKRLQRIYNVLYARVTLDEEFLDSVVGATADDFILRLWTIWRRLRAEGLVQVGLDLSISGGAKAALLAGGCSLSTMTPSTIWRYCSKRSPCFLFLNKLISTIAPSSGPF